MLLIAVHCHVTGLVTIIRVFQCLDMCISVLSPKIHVLIWTIQICTKYLHIHICTCISVPGPNKHVQIWTFSLQLFMCILYWPSIFGQSRYAGPRELHLSYKPQMSRYVCAYLDPVQICTCIFGRGDADMHNFLHGLDMHVPIHTASIYAHAYMNVGTQLLLKWREAWTNSKVHREDLDRKQRRFGAQFHKTTVGNHQECEGNILRGVV